MNYAELDTEELDCILYVCNQMMSVLCKMLKKPCCGDCAELQQNELARLRLKFELVSIELISRTDFTDLENTFFDAKIDHINTVRNERY